MHWGDEQIVLSYGFRTSLKGVENLHMDSYLIARYMEETQGECKPWLLIQLRLQKLKESKTDLSPDEYMQRLNDIHLDLMKLGEWWIGQEEEVFGRNS